MISEQTAAAHKSNVHAGRLACVACVFSVGFVALGALLLALNFSTTGGSPYFVNNVVAALAFSTLGVLLASRRQENPIGWLFLAAGFLYAVVVFVVEYSAYALVTRPGSLTGGVFAAWLSSWVWFPAGLLVLFLLLYFPDGRLPSPRWRPVAFMAALGIGLDTIVYALRPGPLEGVFPTVGNPFGVEGIARFLEPVEAVSTPLFGALVLAPVVALVVRFHRVAGEERQQIKWVAYAAAVLTAAFVVVSLWPELDPSLIGRVLFLAGFVAVPAAIGVAILKYRLYDIDLLINRTLVYGTLTAVVVGLYVLVVGGIGTMFQARGNLLVSLLGVGLVAVLFAPIRDHLQRGVNRIMYGERDDPYAVISRLGERLEGTLAPEAALETIAETVAGALKLPYAVITLKRDREFIKAAEYGNPTGETIVLPLAYQGESVGQLVLVPRSPGEQFSAADKRLLEDLARQAGVAAYAVRLTADLQRSREHLVTAREEERRRLRRDLHDGLGPQLAAQTLKLGSARSLYPRDPAAAEALLSELEADIEVAVSDIRRLVYDLRPPALDDMGLAGAVRDAADWYETKELEISVDAPQELPPLPAAVEVAAYRIAQEALTNVVRHAAASVCAVRLSPTGDMLELEVSDDGVGLPPDRPAGVGLSSMRERAQELGGTCEIGPSPSGGVRILARLSLPGGSKE